MANGQRETTRGAIKQGLLNKGRTVGPGIAPATQPQFPRVQPVKPPTRHANAAQRQPIQGGNVHKPVNPVDRVRGKTVPTANTQSKPVAPHINQHSAHLQRIVQAKMAQPPAPHLKTLQPRSVTPRVPVVQRHVVRTNPSVSRVVQPAGWCSSIGEWFKSLNCWSSSQQQRYENVDEEAAAPPPRSAASSGEASAGPLESEHVAEGSNSNGLAYPIRVHGGLITSCALVLFCDDRSFDCYHAKGGTYKSNHGMMKAPTHIWYVYLTAPSDDEAYVGAYRKHARSFLESCVGEPTLTFQGVAGQNGNIMLDVHSADRVRPTIGRFIY